MAGNQTKTFTVDRFYGIDESADGTTELPMGMASKMVNFFVTDDLNLKTRPGIRVVEDGRGRGTILNSWHGWLGKQEFLAIVDNADGDRVWIYRMNGELNPVEGCSGVSLGGYRKSVNLFSFGGYLYILTDAKAMRFDGEKLVTDGFFYEPKVLVAASPAGGGTTLESINLLTPYRIAEYSSDGEAKDYVLPSEAVSVESVTVDGKAVTGSWNQSAHTYTFQTAPAFGTSNVVFRYKADEQETAAFLERLSRLKLHESYNGSTDTRLFFAGDGTNICYYTSPPTYGKAGDLYLPSLNEVAVDMSGSPVTGLVRHYSRLLVFKPDGVYSISYEPITLPGGDTVAGFYLRPVSREYGHSGYGNICTVSNFARSFTAGGIYEWRQSANSYRDERYAQRVSDAVSRTLAAADLSRMCAADDDGGQTYYVFTNDNYGTILVNRYALVKGGVWCVYRSELAKDIQAAFWMGGKIFFLTNKDLYTLDTGTLYDVPADGEMLAINAQWESGFQHFGADYIRKYSSELYISATGDVASSLMVTAATDKRDSYMEKEVVTPAVFSFLDLHFDGWSFRGGAAPKIKRLRLKVKKFIYYKLIFKVEKPGASLTVLSYDQTVRFSSKAK